jgi:hypothetical protein
VGAGDRVDEKGMAHNSIPTGLQIVARSLIAQGVSEKDVTRELNVPARETHANSKDDKYIKERSRLSIEKIHELALNRTMIALGLMTEDKLESASLKELSQTTTSLAKVLSATAPREESEKESGSSVHFHVHAPEIRDVKSYKVVDV